uniref:Methyltransferase type 11 domain-containing protein n=2 Tax=Ciona intestinalis TaxID=7719 RepID=H2XP68_CIOIN
STGGFSRTHIQAECIKDVVRILKVGGLFWFSVRNTSLACDYNKSVEAVLAELQSTGSIEVILKNKFDYYSYNVEQQDSTEKVAVPGLERCIRKLK